MKNTITGALVLACIILGYLAFFKGSSDDYKKKLAELAASNKALEKQRDSLDLDINSLKAEIAKLENRDSVLNAKIVAQDSEIEKSKRAAQASQQALGKLKKELEQTRKQIDSVKAHPANREGDDLLNSLKIKAQQ